MSGDRQPASSPEYQEPTRDRLYFMEETPPESRPPVPEMQNAQDL